MAFSIHITLTDKIFEIDWLFTRYMNTYNNNLMFLFVPVQIYITRQSNYQFKAICMVNYLKFEWKFENEIVINKNFRSFRPINIDLFRNNSMLLLLLWGFVYFYLFVVVILFVSYISIDWNRNVVSKHIWSIEI